MRRFIGIATVVVGLALVVFGGVWSWLGFHAGPLPEKQSMAVWIPDNAELRPERDVKSGTFKVNISLQEFQARTAVSKHRPLIAYSERRGEGGVRRGVYGPFLEYWLTKGDGTFYYNFTTVPSRPEVSLPFPRKRAIAWSPSFDTEQHSFVYTPREAPGNFLVWGIISGIVGIVVLVVLAYLLAPKSSSLTRDG